MGLPESYQLPSARGAAYNLIGDGVSPPVIQHPARYIFEPLLGRARETAEPSAFKPPRAPLPQGPAPGRLPDIENSSPRRRESPGQAQAASTSTAAVLAGVSVIYCAEEVQARRLLGEMLAADWIAIDIETAPNKTELDRLAELMRAKAEIAGQLKASRKLKVAAVEIATLAAAQKRLAVGIKYAKTAGLDPHRARIRLLQVYAGGDRVLVIDLDKTGAGVLELIDGARVIAHNIAFELAFLEKANVALGGMQCTLQAVRLTLGEHATSLAAAARAYLNVDLDKTLQVSDWNAPICHANADRLRGDRRRRRLADRRENPAPLRGAAVRLRDPDRGRPRGHADGAAWFQARCRGARAADC